MLRDSHQPLVCSGRWSHPSSLCQAILFLVARKMSISAKLTKWQILSFFFFFLSAAIHQSFVGRSVVCLVVLVDGDGLPMG